LPLAPLVAKRQGAPQPAWRQGAWRPGASHLADCCRVWLAWIRRSLGEKRLAAFHQAASGPHYPAAWRPAALRLAEWRPEALHQGATGPHYPAAWRPESLRPESLRPESLRPEPLHPVALHLESLHSVAPRPESLRPELLHPVALHLESLHLESLHPESLHPEPLRRAGCLELAFVLPDRAALRPAEWRRRAPHQEVLRLAPLPLASDLRDPQELRQA